jgi:hypothetical protein
MAAVVGLEDQPGKQSVIGDSSATSYSSGPSKFTSFATDLFKAFVSADLPHYKTTPKLGTSSEV